MSNECRFAEEIPLLLSLLMEKLGFGKEYFEIGRNGCSPFQTMLAYMGGSAFQTVVDNPVTAYRQLIQQYAKDATGKVVDPKIARMETNAVFRASPVAASLSGLGPCLVGVGLKAQAGPKIRFSSRNFLHVG